MVLKDTTTTTMQFQNELLNCENQSLRRGHGSLGISEAESRYSQQHVKAVFMTPLILPSTSLTIFSYHLNDINQRCLRNAPLKIVARLGECPSQDRYKA
ncbi:hypothetical protein V6N11_052233 [Hibiscus sabdariffa]|uniref:Uncharacterized protein n=1 Tax=Hibiscus sabdariffa TaxID=183260 RepID=A0ABR2U9U3_9ROSI